MVLLDRDRVVGRQKRSIQQRFMVEGVSADWLPEFQQDFEPLRALDYSQRGPEIELIWVEIQVVTARAIGGLRQECQSSKSYLSQLPSYFIQDIQSVLLAGMQKKLEAWKKVFPNNNPDNLLTPAASAEA
jgi:hypothetical protein